MTKPIKVAAQSPATAVAGAIAGKLREHTETVVQAVGANAVNQAVKATAIARSYLADEGMDLHVVPDFTKVLINNIECTAIRFYVYARPS